MGLLVGTPPGVSEDRVPQRLLRQGRRKQVLLPIHAAHGDQKPVLFLGLDALGQRLDAEGLGGADHALYQNPVGGLARQFGYEASVDLDAVDGR